MDDDEEKNDIVCSSYTPRTNGAGTSRTGRLLQPRLIPMPVHTSFSKNN